MNIRFYRKQLRLPDRLIESTISSSQGHPFSWAYFRQSKCPARAANDVVFSFQKQPFS